MKNFIALLLAIIAAFWVPAAYASTTERFPRNIYAIVVPGVTVAASATDIFTIYGSASATIRITRIEVTGTQTTAGKVYLQLVKRSAVNTGGTSSSLTPTALSSKLNPPTSTASTPVSTATALSYTVNPASLGTSAGLIMARDVLIPASATAAASDPAYLFDESNYGEPITLNGVAEGIALNLNGVTVTGGSFVVTAYIEETLN